MEHCPPHDRPFGLMAEFATADELLAAAAAVRGVGYTRIDAFAPFPLEGLTEAIGAPRSRLPVAVLVFGLLGAALGFAMQYFATVLHYPINVGGRPLNSWPAYIPVTFELGILLAALAAVIGMLGANGLPMPHHPVFNVSRFARASQDRFFLLIEASDPKFDRKQTRELLERFSPYEVNEVDN